MSATGRSPGLRATPKHHPDTFPRERSGQRRVFSPTVAGAASELDDHVRTDFPFHPARRYGPACKAPVAGEV